MSRRNKDRLYTQCFVVCNAGHRVGAVFKDQQVGDYAVGKGLTLEGPTRPHVRPVDSTTDGGDGGRVRARCPECGDDVQVRWSRVQAALDSAETAGRTRTTVGPSSGH